MARAGCTIQMEAPRWRPSPVRCTSLKPSAISPKPSDPESSVHRRRDGATAGGGLRSRQRLARQLLLAIGGLVDEGGDDHRVLAHVRFLDSFVAVHVGVVRAGVVL